MEPGRVSPAGEVAHRDSVVRARHRHGHASGGVLIRTLQRLGQQRGRWHNVSQTASLHVLLGRAQQFLLRQSRLGAKLGLGLGLGLNFKNKA